MSRQVRFAAVISAALLISALVPPTKVSADTPRLGYVGHIVVSKRTGNRAIKVNDVLLGSAAQLMGLRAGDYILRINKAIPKSQTHIDNAMISAGGLVVLKVRRGNGITHLRGQLVGVSSTPTIVAPAVPVTTEASDERTNLQKLQVKVSRERGVNGYQLRISAVGKTGLGSQFGLAVGDVILTMNGQKATTIRGYREAVARANSLRFVVRSLSGEIRQVIVR